MTNPEQNLSSHEKIHLTNAEVFQKAFRLIDSVYDTPQIMTEKAVAVIKEKCPELTNGQLIGFSASYLALMIPQIPSNAFAAAIVQICTDLIDYHYGSLMCEVTGLSPEVLFKLEPTEMYYTVLEAVTKKIEEGIKS